MFSLQLSGYRFFILKCKISAFNRHSKVKAEPGSPKEIYQRLPLTTYQRNRPQDKTPNGWFGFGGFCGYIPPPTKTPKMPLF